MKEEKEVKKEKKFYANVHAGKDATKAKDLLIIFTKLLFWDLN